MQASFPINVPPSLSFAISYRPDKKKTTPVALSRFPENFMRILEIHPEQKKKGCAMRFLEKKVVFLRDLFGVAS